MSATEYAWVHQDPLLLFIRSMSATKHEWNQQTRELISAQKTSHIDNNKSLSRQWYFSPGMQVNTRYINSTTRSGPHYILQLEWVVTDLPCTVIVIQVGQMLRQHMQNENAAVYFIFTLSFDLKIWSSLPVWYQLRKKNINYKATDFQRFFSKKVHSYSSCPGRKYVNYLP